MRDLSRAAIRAAALLSGSALALGGCAGTDAARARPDTLALGRNAAGEPCTATRNWRDPKVTDTFDQSWSINCRNVAASRSLGTVRVLANEADREAALKTLDCGEAASVSLTALGPVSARRCYDAGLAIETVAFDFQRRGHTVIVSASPAIVGPAEEAARIVSGAAAPSKDAGRQTTAQIEPGSLPTSPAAERASAGALAFDPAVPLAEGIALNHKGLHVQASRVLNDALSRLPADAPPATRAELLLEAGLADSNIRFQDSAAEHFAEANALLANVGGERGAFLGRKRDAYRALDLLNQHKFREALAALDQLVSRPVAASQPLQDPAIVRVLNQGAGQRNDVSSSIAVPETATLSQLVLDAQANWARSVAMGALGDATGAQAALDRAQAAYTPLINERIDPTLILWLGAHIHRQRGRLQARRGEYDAAVASFDRALDELRRSAVGTAGTGTEPAIAETQLERASIIADRGGDPGRVRQEYDQAVDALIAANQTGGGILPTGLERYLDLLVAEAKDGAKPDTYERFFRAMQAVGEPAVARQLSQLQTVVTADPAVGVKVRDRAELEREITRLRYEIAAGGEGATPAAELERQRQAAEAKLLQIDSELSSDTRFRTIDDRPATIEDIRKALRPNEAFWKIAELNRRAYAILINADQTYIYPLIAPKKDLDQLAADIRASIDGKLDQGLLVQYDVAKAYTLFRLMTGPATDALLKAQALVVDPAGPLEALPASVLVTDQDSIKWRDSIAKQRPFDFSQVKFLAAHATISTAVSPRSFLVARALPPSTAKQPFLGLGDHAPATASAAGAREVSVGFGCSVPFNTLADLSQRLKPIDKHEIEIASQALGVPNAPEMVGTQFSDTAVEERKDLADFEVLHFATHGLEEGVWGCSKSPPALVTSFGDQTSDGLLSFSEIARLRLDANLVVLSACDTASGVKDEALARRSGQEEAGSTLEGLVRAFLTANSRAVLATFWPVSADQETDQFIKAFYGTARSRNIGGSLQTAQETLIKNPEFSHPFYWGPYFVVGDSTKMMLTQGSVAAKMRPTGKTLAAK
jgi:CHAT domain-containing protein